MISNKETMNGHFVNVLLAKNHFIKQIKYLHQNYIPNNKDLSWKYTGI